MFGPNTDVEVNIKTDFSHRDTKFIDLYKKLTNTFIEKFSLNDYDVLFIPGSGTLAMESLFWSSTKHIEVVGPKGIWYDKWKLFSNVYERHRMYGSDKLYCQLETSIGSIYHEEGCLVDGISSFPYYDIPNNTKVFVTCSNKQLGSMAGLSIVFVKKDYWKNLKNNDKFSYLNLSRYKQYGFLGQTPSTAPVTIIQHLYEQIKSLNISNLRDKINNNSKLLIDLFGGTTSPVFNIPKNKIPIEIAFKYNLYGLNTDSKNYSIFTYSSDDICYYNFVKDFKK